MRSTGQNLVGSNGARLRAWDAGGANPVTLIVFSSDVANAAQGDRILVVSPGFAAGQSAISGDFTMTSLIPASYLAAGRLTFESSTGTVLWSLAWGGAAYTGSSMGATTNDADGNFGPPFASALPSTSTQALRFTATDPTGSALSTNNAADYGVTAGAAGFTNNARSSGTVTPPVGQADLSVSLADSPDPVAPSQPIVFTVGVVNAGPAAAASVSVSYLFPAGTAIQNITGTGWSCAISPGVATCTRATLAVGTAPSITVVLLAPSSPGIVTTTASISSATADPTPANNSDTEMTTVSGSPTPVDLAITKSDGGLEGRYGFPMTYTLTATNNGAVAVSGATVTDTFPAGLDTVSWTCSASAGSTCPASGSGNIAASLILLSGGTATFTATGTLAAGTPSPLVNTATIAPPAAVPDPTPANNSSTVSTVLGNAAFNTGTPCRVADTRNAVGDSGGPALAANTVRAFPVTGLCGVPADARAVVLNITVVQPTDVGDLRLFPAGTAAPLASTINFGAGAVRANNAIISLGAGGRLAVQCDMPTGSTHVLIDVAAYFR
jgi:uncharacterized repeat protein (TIGR01451 family)